MYVCMYIYVRRVCMYIGVSLHAHRHEHFQTTYTHTYIYIHAYTHIYTYTHTHKYTGNAHDDERERNAIAFLSKETLLRFFRTLRFFLKKRYCVSFFIISCCEVLEVLCIRICMYVCTCGYICVCVCMYVYIRARARTHTHISHTSQKNTCRTA